MNKNNVFMKHIKRTLSIVLACVVMITLSGCAESSDKNPYGDLSLNDVYATSGDYSLTVGDLYDELRHYSLGYLEQRIEEAVFQDYLELTDSKNEDQQELVAEYILTAIYETYDEEEIEKLSTYTKTQAVKKYVDTMYLESYTITTSQLNGLITTEQIIGSDAFTILWDKYAIDVAKYLYAYDVLTDEIKTYNEEADEDDELEHYFTDAEIATYFDNNYSYDFDVEAIIVRFINQNEANALLKKFGIKTYNGEWYLIQPPVDNNGVTDYSKWSNESDYNSYYDEYTISQSDSSQADSPISLLGSDTTILKIYVEIYNYIYTYRNTLTYSTRNTIWGNVSADKEFLTYYELMKEIIDFDQKGVGTETYAELVSSLASDANTTFSREKLDTYSTSLTSYLHDTLSTEAEIDEDTGLEESFTQYTASARSYNNNYYLMFKMSDPVKDEFYEILEDDNEEEYYEFDLTLMYDAETTFYDHIYNELFEEKLTSSYISTQANNRYDYVTVEIYDSTVDYYYSQANTSYTGTKGFENNLVALITFYDKKGNTIYNGSKTTKWEVKFTVQENYDFLEKLYGGQVAVAKLFDQEILDSTYYKEIKDEKDSYQTYKDSVYSTLNYFANDGYSSYGYPASIGKYSFMKNYFRTANVDEAIEYLMLQEAKRQFYLDLPEDFYSTMFDFSSLAYDNYYALTVNNILVYVDMDEDGVADEEWFSCDDDYGYHLTETQKIDLANDLINEIIKQVKYSTEDLLTSFSTIVEEYNSSTRIEPSNDPSLSGSVESIWAKYRKYGLYISTTSLNEFSNTSVDQDEEIQSLVKNLYNNSELIMNNSFTGSYLLSDSTDFIVNDEGINLLLVTNGNGKTDIDMDSEDEDIYTNVPIKIDDSYKIYETLMSTSEKANEIQVEVFCREYFATGSSTSLSTSATSHLEAYLTPLLTKYNSEVVQMMIMYNHIGSISWKFDSRTSELERYIQYLQDVSDNYTDTTSNESTSNFKGFWDYINTIGGAI